ncbi:MAG: DUF1501 domain-containing protein [Lentisphaeraceae bacterium]|nr:DUF1501 domain-containing protein [Lentisphaeraceae bacterium]
MKNIFLKSDEITRRHMVKGLAAGLLGVNFTTQIASARTSTLRGGGKAKSVIFINVSGGFSQVDSFDIKEANKDANQASAPIKSSADGIRVGKYFAGMAKHMDKFAVINSMCHTQGTHHHASYLTRTGYESRGTVAHPELGAWASKLGGKSSGAIPSFIKIGNSGGAGRGFFSSQFSALPVKDPTKGIQFVKTPKGLSDSDFKKRVSYLDKINQAFEAKMKNNITKDYSDIYDQALKMMTSRDLTAFDLNLEKDATRERYGKNEFGNSCLLARRLVEKGVRYMSLDHGGWDDHYGIYGEFKDRAVSLDQGVAALMYDLSSMGLLDQTLVVFTSEFGRSSELNSQGGRGHNPLGYTAMLAGAGIKGGQKYGKTDKMGGTAVDKKVHPTDLNATIGYAMGLPIDHIEYNQTGRPFQLANKTGKPVTQLF